jgi:hypothetical protein
MNLSQFHLCQLEIIACSKDWFSNIENPFLKMLALYLNLHIWLCVVLKIGRFGQQIRNTWRVLKCGAGEGWRRSVRPIM